MTKCICYTNMHPECRAEIECLQNEKDQMYRLGRKIEIERDDLKAQLAKVVEEAAHLAWKTLHDMKEDAAASVVSEKIRALEARLAKVEKLAINGQNSSALKAQTALARIRGLAEKKK